MLFHIDPLRLWVHKVLPVVYDDSLSYYEVLAKVTKKLNEVIDLTEEQNQYIEEFSTNLTNAINHWEDGMEQEWSSYKSDLNNEWGAFQRNTEQYIENWKNMTESDIEDAIAAGINQFVSYFSDLTQTAVDAAERAMEAAETAAQDAVEAVMPTLESEFDERYAWKTAVGSPLVATTAAGMTDTTKVYVYAGSETGYVNGDWYYYDGTTWQGGGVYNSAAVVTDPTLSESGVPADAKAAGDEIADLKSAIVTANVNILNAYIEKTASGSTISFNDGANNIPIKEFTSILKPVQTGSGDPSPNNIRPFVPYTAFVYNHNETTKTISFPNNLSQAYDFSIDLINKKLYLNGAFITLTNLAWAKNSNRYWVNVPEMKKAAGGVKGYCNIFKPVMGTAGADNTISFGDTNFSSSARIVIYDSVHTTLESFKEYLTTLSNNGTPAQAVFPLLTPTVYDISADEIRTILGENVFETDGNTTITYRADINLFLKNQAGNEKTILYGLQENTDISSIVNSALTTEGVNVVEIPNGTYLIGQTIAVPDNKTLILQGDYENPSITPTTIIPTATGETLFTIGDKAHFEGGYINLGTYENTIALKLDCHKTAIQFSTIKKTKITGGRTASSIFNQTGVLVECDYASGETVSTYGYLMECKFDLRIENVGYAYHFHRQTSPSSASGVWLTENDIYGFIYHCTRYIWYDFNTYQYANNDSIIGATLQADSLLSGETNYPGINIWGWGINIVGMLWDFNGSPHQTPAVYFEQGAQNNIVTRRGAVQDYALSNNSDVTTNVTRSMISRYISYRKINYALYTSDNFDASDYVEQITNNSYRLGDVIYIDITFKVTTTLPIYSNIFTFDDDAFLTTYSLPLVRADTNVLLCSAQINKTSPHATMITSQITGSNIWLNIRGTILSNRISNFTM